MTVRAELEGHPLDLEALIRHFGTGDPQVVADDGSVYVEASALNGLFNDGGQMVAVAGRILSRMNGIASLDDASYRPVRLRKRFVDGVSESAHVVATAEARLAGLVSVVATAGVAEGRGAAGAATIGESRPPRGVRLLALAGQNPDVAELADVLSAEKLSWGELYKAYEIICHAVGGQQGLFDPGWTTKPELRRFTGSANRPDVSGVEARHARMSGERPAQVMILDEGQVYIRELARKWLDSLL